MRRKATSNPGDDDGNLFDLTGTTVPEEELTPEPPARRTASRKASPRVGSSPTPPPTPQPPPATGDALRRHLHKGFPLQGGSGLPNQTSAFKIDDHNLRLARDRWVWLITARVLDTDPPTLVIRFGSIPYDEQLGTFLQDRGICVTVDDRHATFDLKMQSKFAPTIRKLIPAVRRVATGFRERQWLTKRVGDSLDQLAAHLSGFNPPAAAPATPPSKKPAPRSGRRPPATGSQS